MKFREYRHSDYESLVRRIIEYENYESVFHRNAIFIFHGENCTAKLFGGVRSNLVEAYVYGDSEEKEKKFLDNLEKKLYLKHLINQETK